MTGFRDEKGGWFRLWRTGPGIAWTLQTQPLLFSERIGKTGYLLVGRWRVKLLRPSFLP